MVVLPPSPWTLLSSFIFIFLGQEEEEGAGQKGTCAAARSPHRPRRPLPRSPFPDLYTSASSLTNAATASPEQRPHPHRRSLYVPTDLPPQHHGHGARYVSYSMAIPLLHPMCSTICLCAVMVKCHSVFSSCLVQLIVVSASFKQSKNP